MNRPPACIFDVNEMGNKEFTWSGLTLTNHWGLQIFLIRELFQTLVARRL